MQFQKAEQEVCESKDKLITTGTIREERVMAISGEGKNEMHLPSEQHPFDHYVCLAVIEWP